MKHPILIKNSGEDQFEGQSAFAYLPRYYGGEIMAQAVFSCGKTVEKNLILHSLNVTFLKEAKIDSPLIHHVNRLKDGRQFSVRQVNLMQEDCVVCSAIASFQLPAAGADHQIEMPNVCLPETLQNDEQRFDSEAPAKMKKINPFNIWPFDCREVDPVNMFHPEKKPPHSMIWFRSKDCFDHDTVVQQAMMAFISDASFLASALRPHGLGFWAGNVQQATLNHGMWFHRPFQIDKWHLFSIESPVAHGGRAIVYGNIFKQNGELVATAVQEGVVRPV